MQTNISTLTVNNETIFFADGLSQTQAERLTDLVEPTFAFDVQNIIDQLQAYKNSGESHISANALITLAWYSPAVKIKNTTREE